MLNRRTMMLQCAAALAASGLFPNGAAEVKGRRSSAGQRLGPELASLGDFEELAKRRLPHMAYEYIAGGAGDEVTIRWNREAFDDIKLVPRVLAEVEPVDTSVELFGRRLSLPLLFAPTAFQRMAHPEGEVAAAQGASDARVPFVVSSLSTRRLEDIARATSQGLWFQFFTLQKERRPFVRDVLQEIKSTGCQALVVTVDAPVTGARNRSERARFKLPDHFETPYYPDRAGRKQSGGLPVSGPLVWADIDWLRANTTLPVLLKGIMHPADAQQAARLGVSGIIVSNHGGRELDTVPASISVLPKIMEAVDGTLPVLLDSGVRRGTDMIKAIALGAKAVLIGRPYLYGMACGGAAGAARVADILRREFEMAMVLLGKKTVAQIDRSVFFQR